MGFRPRSLEGFGPVTNVPGSVSCSRTFSRRAKLSRESETYVIHFCTTPAGIFQAGARIRSSSGSTTVSRSLNAKAIACLPKAVRG